MVSPEFLRTSARRCSPRLLIMFFFFKDTATTETYTLSLHDALPILHYGPAKAALLQLTRHLAAELGPEGIRVNALVPGPFPRQAEAEFGKRLAARTMLGRLGKPGEIAGPLLLLASPASSFITGSALSVDGG